MDGLILRIIFVVIAIILLSVDTYRQYKSKRSKDE